MADNTDPLNDIYTRVANALRQQLPPELLESLDRILGENPSPKERWIMYDNAKTLRDNLKQ